jgi:hypothetical protein
MEEALLKKKGFADADQSLPKFFFFFLIEECNCGGYPRSDRTN